MGAGVVKEAAGPSSQTTSASFSNKSSLEMSCEACSVSFTVFKRKKNCSDCNKYHCSDCLTKEKLGSTTKRRCANCRLLNSGNFTRTDLMELKVKDMRHFLQRRNVSIQDCREKDDLIELILSYSNNSSWRQQQEERRRHLEELKERKRQADANSRANLRQRQTPSTPAEDMHPESGDSSTASDSPSDSPVTSARREGAPPSGPAPPGPGVPPPSYEETSTRVEDFTDQQQSNQEADENGDNNLDNTTSEPTARGRASLETVAEVGEIEELTVRQLKEILAANFVDYKGCCEKWELMERVKRLWQDHKHNTEKDDTSGAKEDDLCKICMDAIIDCVLLECGHMVTCTQCGKRMSECPVCRQYVIRVVHIFRA